MVLEENMAVKEKEGEVEEEDEEHEEDEAEDEEYESDPEDAALSLAMRRREASDDEEGEDRERVTRIDLRVEIGGSDGKSNGQGGVEVYDDEESEMEEEEEELEEEGVEEEKYEEEIASEGDREVGGVEVRVVGEEFGGDEQRSNVGDTEFENKDQEEGEKKENEPFAVPTAGAFYMHDGRFRENGGGRHRRTPGGRKLWESRDDRKWGHDKFEELNSQDRQYDKEGRSSRGRFRGRGKVRGLDRRNPRGNSKPRAFDGRNNTNQPVSTVRGRGPRRYEPHARNINRDRDTPTQNKQTGRSHEPTSNANSGRAPTNTRTSNTQSDQAPPRKHVFASSLNSASPPFYPSGSSNQDNPQSQSQRIGNKNKIPNSQSTSSLRGKNTADDADKLYYDDPPQTFYGKFNNLQIQSSGPMQNTQSSQGKSKGRGVGVTIPEQLGYQPAGSYNQANRVQQRPAQGTVQPYLRGSSQQLGQGVSQASFPPNASPTSSAEPGETVSPPGSCKSRTQLVGKGKGTVQGNGRGLFLYNGAQVMGVSGNMGVPHSDQNFPASPALLQVMQFGGQHPGVGGVPAVGMALPGYVAQPQLGGFGNSEMTWVPMLAGAAGALGASYCSPYIAAAVDGNYYSRPTGTPQTSSSGVSSKERSTSKSSKTPPQRSDITNDEFGQR